MKRDIRFWLIFAAILMDISVLFKLAPIQFDSGVYNDDLTFLILLTTCNLLICCAMFRSNKLTIMSITLSIIIEIKTAWTLFDLSLFNQLWEVLLYPLMHIVCLIILWYLPKLQKQDDTVQ